jgi:hypothetical protein
MTPCEANLRRLCMKIRQAYEGRVIEARSSELKDGGWDCGFSIEDHEATGVTETAFYVPGVFPSAEAAILGCDGRKAEDRFRFRVQGRCRVSTVRTGHHVGPARLNPRDLLVVSFFGGARFGHPTIPMDAPLVARGSRPYSARRPRRYLVLAGA